MASIDIAKLQANLLTNDQTGDRQVLESTIFQVMPLMFADMPSSLYVNNIGTQDAAGNITITKVAHNKPITRNYDAIGDLSKYNDIRTQKIFIQIDQLLETPVRYESTEIAMSPEGIMQQVQQGINMNIAETRELSILQKEYDAAAANGTSTDSYLGNESQYAIDIKTATASELEELIDAAIVDLRNRQDVNVRKVGKNQIILKLRPDAYMKLLRVKLIIPGAPSTNEDDFTTGAFNRGFYKGIQIIEDVYFEDVADDFLGSLFMVGAIASP